MKLKKLMASCLTAAMIMGLGATTYADPALTSSGDQIGSGAQVSSGASEGYVAKNIANVILPTTTNNTFAFTVDPQRLVSATLDSQDKTLEGTAAADGVYFMTSGATYNSTSNAVYFVNKSTYDVKLTVKAKATLATSNPISLSSDASASALVSGGTEPLLYLGLKVGSTEKAIMTDAMSSGAEKVIAANEDGYEVKFDSSANPKYTYDEVEDASWNAVAIQLTGKVGDVSDEIEAVEKNAPQSVEVTWAWEKAAEDAVASNDVVGWQNGEIVDADVSGGSGSGNAVTPTTMKTVSKSGTTVSCRLADGLNATANKITSVKVGSTTVSSTSSGSAMYYEVVASGAIKIYNVSAASGTVTIVHDGTTYTGSF